MTYYHVPPNNVAIELLGRTYTIKCGKEEKPQLDRAVNILKKEMQQILQKQNHPSPEQLAIVAALNLAVKYEKLLGSTDENTQHAEQENIDTMVEQCQAVLAETI